MSLDNIKNIKAAEFRYKDGKNGSSERLTLGVMAQDIEKIYPYNDYSILQKDENGYYMVEYSQLIAPMIKAIQELSVEIDELKEIIKK